MRRLKEQYAHCMTVVHKDATVCPGCRSLRGYAANGYGVMGKASVIAFGVALPAIITVAFPPAAIVSVPLALFCLWRVWNGPY